MHHHVYVIYIIHMEYMSPPMDPETWGALAIVVSLTQQRRQQYRPKGSQWQPHGTLGKVSSIIARQGTKRTRGSAAKH